MTKKPIIFSAAALQNKQFDPLKWVVPGYIVEGCSILAGRPKLGKSWMMLGVAIGVADGTVALGEKCEGGDVLYIALEDNERRLKRRLRTLLKKKPWPRKLHYATEWPRSDDGGLGEIRKWIANHPDARLIIIDVLAKFRSPRTNGQTLYEGDYEAVQGLQQIASQTNVAIVIVHHVRKLGSEGDPFEKVSGTFGISGAADSVLVLDRDSSGTTLYGRGRDIEDIDMAMEFSKLTCKWTVLGETSEVRVQDQRKKIIEVLKDCAMKPSDLAQAVGMKGGNVRQLLMKMAKDGQVTKGKGALYTCQ